MQEANARIENTIRSIKEAQQKKKKTRQARQELTDFRESMEALANKELEEKIARKMGKAEREAEPEKGKESGQRKRERTVCPGFGRTAGAERGRNALQPSPPAATSE